MDDYFRVFGMPRKLGLDGEELQRRFYELARRCHPDFHQSSPTAAQAAALSASAQVNRAYRALRDPLARVEYLVALEGGAATSSAERGASTVPPALLAEMMDIQEALEEAKAGGLDGGGRERLAGERQRLLARYEAEHQAILARMGDWDATVEGSADRHELLAWFKERLATRAFLRTAIGDLGGALGEEEDDRHGAHRRH